MELIKICLNTYGTRVVQKMIETVKTKQQIALVKSALKPSFLALVKDLNGNHVIQSCLQSLGPNDIKKLLQTTMLRLLLIATDAVCFNVAFQTLLDCNMRDSLLKYPDTHFTFLRILLRNYVVQYLIEQQVSAVKLLIQFRMHYAELATQKFCSHVTEKCLRKYPESQAEIVRELLSVPNFEHLLQDSYANYVIQTALSVTKRAIRARLVEKVYRFGKLRSSTYCKKIFSKTILKK